MSNVLPEHVIATLRERRQRAARHDCQGERPFLSVRTRAADVRESIRHAADAKRMALRKRILDDLEADCELGSRAQTLYWIRQALKEIEMEGRDGA